MTTFVTGATGFLGRHLVRLLAERGDRIRALVRSSRANTELRELGIEVHAGEITDPAAVRRAAEGCDLVFHLAGIVSHELRDLPRLKAVNVEGTRILLAGADAEARIVHVSSIVAIGPAPSRDRPADESQPYPARAERLPYSATKRAGEQLALAEAGRGRDLVVANPGFLIGPGDVYQVSTWPVRRYLEGKLRFYIEGGLSLVDARDAAAGLVALAERGQVGERYILTSMEGNLSHAELFHRIGRVTGVRRRMLRVPTRVGFALTTLVPWPVKPGQARAAANWWFYKTAKAERELGFTTRAFDETIADTAAQYIGT